MASQLTARHWIDGEWMDGGERAVSVNPANGEPIGSYSEAGEAEAKRAITAALRSFRESGWRNDRRLRARVINEMADRFEARTDDLVRILCLENGKVEAEARFEVNMVPSKLRFYAACAVEFTDRALYTVPGAGASGRLHDGRQAPGLHRADERSHVRGHERSEDPAAGRHQRLQ
jgi:betaine-aldehyde dehydrogenase